MKTVNKNIMQILVHKSTGVKFQYHSEYKPQFSDVTFVRLLNLKSNRIENFNKSTYQYFFEIAIDK